MRYDARIETPVGAIDGVNTIFVLSRPFAGEPVVFLNGQARAQSGDDGWDHDGMQTITLRQTPVEGDVVQVWFLPKP